MQIGKGGKPRSTAASPRAEIHLPANCWSEASWNQMPSSFVIRPLKKGHWVPFDPMEPSTWYRLVPGPSRTLTLVESLYTQIGRESACGKTGVGVSVCVAVCVAVGVGV